MLPNLKPQRKVNQHSFAWVSQVSMKHISLSVLMRLLLLHLLLTFLLQVPSTDLFSVDPKSFSPNLKEAFAGSSSINPRNF